jgi:hypothetical protein
MKVCPKCFFTTIERIYYNDYKWAFLKKKEMRSMTKCLTAKRVSSTEQPPSVAPTFLFAIPAIGLFAMTAVSFVEYCPTCNVTFCGEHLVLVTYLHGEESFCGDCNSILSLILKHANEYVLCKLYELEALCDYPDRYESDPMNETITDLFVEQTRMKQRWDQLCILDPKSKRVTNFFVEQELGVLRMKQPWHQTCCISISK